MAPPERGAANRVVVPLQMWSWVSVPARPLFIGSPLLHHARGHDPIANKFVKGALPALSRTLLLGYRLHLLNELLRSMDVGITLFEPSFRTP